MDAGKNTKGVTQLVFHKLRTAGKNKNRFLDLFGFGELLAPRLDVFRTQSRNLDFSKSLESFLGDEDLTALLIRDFNTCGLGGKFDRYERGDHFSRLVCALNLDDKADGDVNSGGSFGLGKTAYAKSSRINTVIYHSTFKASSETRDKNRRLMAAGVYPRHKYAGKDFGGFAYYGKPASGDQAIAIPYEDAEAENLWGRIGELFEADISRSADQHGTDILILVSALDLSALKRAVEDYYFPAIINGDLSVKFIEEDGSIDFPRPEERNDLDQFVRLTKTAKAQSEIKEDGVEVANLQRYQKHKIGRVAFESAEQDEAASEKSNCVAIMRGTGMIINYVKMGSDAYEPAVGAFVADEEIWKYLIASENAAHSEWSEHSRRLQQDFPENGKRIVGRLNRNVESRFRQFQKLLQPDVATTRTQTGLLSRLLSGALAGKAGDISPPPGGPRPVSIRLNKRKREDAVSIWRLQVRDNEHTPEQLFRLRLSPSVSLAGERKMTKLAHKNVRVKDSEGVIVGQGASPELEYEFKKGFSIDLSVEFGDPGKQNFIVQCKCIAELDEVSA